MYEAHRYVRTLHADLTAPTQVYGPEAVSGGDFASSAGWTLDNCTISGGVLSFSGSLGTATTTAAQSIVAASYLCSINVVTTDGALVIELSIGGSGFNQIPGSDTTGVKSVVITTAATNQLIVIRSQIATCTLDNFSVRQIL